MGVFTRVEVEANTKGIRIFRLVWVSQRITTLQTMFL
jgi:hypothetical protein